MKCRIYFLCAFLISVLIFSFSNFNKSDSLRQSDFIRRPIVKYLSKKYYIKADENKKDINTKLKKNPENKEMISKKEWMKITGKVSIFIRKSAHVFLYFSFTIFLLLGFKEINFRSNMEYIKYSIIICFSYAIFDEFHQLFSSGRDAKLSDVFVDIIGGIIAIIVFLTVKHNSIKRKGGIKYEV